MENTELQQNNVIENALVKENITTQVLAKLKQDYSNLEIKGLEDKEGYKKVMEGQSACRNVRVLAVKICKSGREDAIKIQKDWIAKEKEIVSTVDEVESILDAERKRIDDLKAKALFEAAQKEKLPLRVEKLASIGYSVIDDELLVINDIQFEALFNGFYAEKLENQRLENERIAAENVAKEKAIEDARLESENKSRIEKEKAEAVQSAIIKAEAEAKEQIEQAKREKADAEAKAEQERINAIEREKQAKIKAEQDKQLAVKAAEDKAKQDAIDKENAIIAENNAKEISRLKAIEEANIAPDKDKLLSIIAKIEALQKELPTLETHNAKVILSNITQLFNKTKVYINEQVNSL